MKIYSVILSGLLLAFSCKNNKPAATQLKQDTSGITATGILNNKTGLDGCGWVIKLPVKDSHSHEFLEPLNLDKFKIPLVEGKKVEITYAEENTNSGCMIGTIVSVKSIKEIK